MLHLGAYSVASDNKRQAKIDLCNALQLKNSHSLLRGIFATFDGIRAELEFVPESQEGLTHNCRNRLQLDRIMSKSFAIPYL